MKKFLIIISVITVLAVIIFCIYSFKYQKQKSPEIEQKVIEWYIENNKAPYKNFGSYEEYLENNKIGE